MRNASACFFTIFGDMKAIKPLYFLTGLLTFVCPYIPTQLGFDTWPACPDDGKRSQACLKRLELLCKTKSKIGGLTESAFKLA